MDKAIIEKLKNEEKALDSTLAINHKKPYTVKKITTPKKKKSKNKKTKTKTTQETKIKKNKTQQITQTLKNNKKNI